MKIVLATRNPGKLAELAALLREIPLELVSAADFSGVPVVDEDQPTLHGNARKKAVTLHQHSGLPALADDTGLEVDALDGAPGVRSARFAGEAADDAANRRMLLSKMSGETDRSARFRTVVALADADGVVYFEGTCVGRIIESERGDGGFGYDSIFEPEGLGRTFAEMTGDEKNAISHRGRALRHVAAYLASRRGGANL